MLNRIQPYKPIPVILACLSINFNLGIQFAILSLGVNLMIKIVRGLNCDLQGLAKTHALEWD